jgi:hypothetical protein
MTRKLLIARLGAGSITVALCAALPGCNLGVMRNGCVGDPAARGMSTVTCPDGQAPDTSPSSDGPRDAPATDAPRDGVGPTGDGAGDRGSGDVL